MPALRDLTGQTLGLWNVLERDPTPSTGRPTVRWICRCACGTTRSVLSASLIKGASRSCGCAEVKSYAVDLLGQTFGRLLVVGRDDWGPRENGYRRVRWFCTCECGEFVTVRSTHLMSEKSKARSCGCLMREMAKEHLTGNTYGVVHGHTASETRSSTYHSWCAMKQRCLNPNNIKFKWYGGADPPVRIHEPWLEYVNFLADMGERPPGTTLGRYNDVGNYEPGNVAWMTPQEQIANRPKVRRGIRTDETLPPHPVPVGVPRD